MILSDPINLTGVSNPFCTRFVRPGSIPYRFCDDLTPEASEARLLALCATIQQNSATLIVGPHGSGKTALLRTLSPLLIDAFPELAMVQLSSCPAGGFLRRLRSAQHTAREVRARQRRLAVGGLLIVDGVEQLTGRDRLWLRRAVRRRGQSLLGTSHVALAGMKTLIETRVSRRLVQSLTRCLLDDAAPAVVEAAERELNQQDWSKLTNVREFWFALYDAVHPHLGTGRTEGRRPASVVSIEKW